MRLLPVVLGVLVLATVQFPTVSAVQINTLVYFVTDNGSWTSGSTTVDEGVLTDFTVGGNTIRLDTVTDGYEAIGATTPSCSVQIKVNGGLQDTLTCNGGFRVYFIVQESTYVAATGTLFPRAIAGYAEAMMGSGANPYWNGTHVVKNDGDGDQEHLGTCLECVVNTVWADLGQKTITCPAGSTLREWTNISTPDGFFRSTGPRVIGTC